MSERSRAITVEQLLALNDEIRALVRAGIPLDRGLRALGGDLPGRLGTLARALSERLQQGESLEQAIQAHGETFPPVYRAVVAAGVRGGRLSLALESIAKSVRKAAELRRTMIVSMVYPLILAAIGSAIFVLSVAYTAPTVSDVYAGLEVEKPDWYWWTLTIAEPTVGLMPWLWGAVLIGGIFWLIQSNRAARLGARSWFLVPTIGSVRAMGRTATFAEVLAMLIEQQVPLHEAVPLAGQAAGGTQLRRAANEIGDALRRGDTVAPRVKGIPPLLVWLLFASDQDPHLVRALNHTAATYRQRAARTSAFLGSYLPIILAAVIGGGIVLYYVLMMMAPFYYLLYAIGQPN